MPWPDETRTDELSAYRIKLFKEARRQERSIGPDGVLPVGPGTRTQCVLPVVRSLSPDGVPSVASETGPPAGCASSAKDQGR